MEGLDFLGNGVCEGLEKGTRKSALPDESRPEFLSATWPRVGDTVEGPGAGLGEVRGRLLTPALELQQENPEAEVSF